MEYSGFDTYGAPIRVGIREDRAQFFKAYEFNGYGKAWTKWELLEDNNKCEIIEDGEKVKWGWNKLEKTGAKIRLPKA